MPTPVQVPSRSTEHPSPVRTRFVLARLWLVAAAFTLVALVESIHVDVPFRDPGGDWLVSRVELSAMLFVGFVVLEALLRSRRGARSPRALWAGVRERWPLRRLATAWAALLAYHAVYVVYHNLKSWNVFNQPRDGGLERVDRWIFAGHSPAVVLHDLFGQGVADHVLVAWYDLFGRLVVVSIVAAVFVRPLRGGVTALAAGLWVWILGTATYYLIPSLGPFHERPQDFAGLPHTSITDAQAALLVQRDHLLAHPGASDAFAQIAAFSSLHVGVTTVITLSAFRLGFRRLGYVLTVFLAGTCVATVYLGYHFFVDLPAGFLVGWLSVQLGAWTTGARRRRAAAPGGPGTPAAEVPAGGAGG
jgi:hypothetical protein